MTGAWVVARYTVRECVRRRVFVVVPVATVAFVSLYAVGNHYAFQSASGTTVGPGGLVDVRALAGATLVGLAMFVGLFLGSALGIFLTFASVRGDAETGLLQQLVVRPVARSGLLVGRVAGASAVAGAFVAFLYATAVAVTATIGGWTPDPLVLPGLHLVGAVVVVVALSVLGSIYLTALPNGIAMFMLYGAGLLGGLLGQLGEVLGSETLESVGRGTSWALPFEALYQAGLDALTSDATGLTRVVVRLGPLGGAEAGGAALWAWAAGYVVVVGGIALAAFARRDL
ncbi:MAG TPA: hypothetical protein VHJ34_10260 [Actinomycetota bacterium]|nr:hypothetical protein [Actinomycetota bacterium]